MHSVVVLPRLHPDNGAGEVGEVVQSASHGTEHTGDALLASHAGAHADLGPATGAAAERIDPAPSGRHAHRTRDIRTDTDATTLRQQRGLTTSRATGRVTGGMRVETVAPEAVG